MPLSKCLNPVRIKASDGAYKYVPCGKCEACRSLKSFIWKKRLDSEMMSHHYTLAITLTYDDAHVPYVKVHRSTGFCELHYLERSPTLYVPKDIVQDLGVYYAINKDDTFTVLTICHNDLQQFITNLRFYAKNIRWFIQSEIGPSTFRPHYHGLLFFSEYDPEYVKTCIFKAWEKCDWTIREHQDSIHLCYSSSYCTSYVASVLDLPKFHNYKRFAQFHYSSNRPPIGSYVYDSASIESFSAADSLYLPLYDIKNNEYASLPFLRSVKDSYFGKLPYNSLLSDAARKFLLMSYRYFSPAYPINRVRKSSYKFRHFAEAFSQWFEKYPALFSTIEKAIQSESSLYHIYRISKNYNTLREDVHPLYVDYVRDLYDYKVEMSKLKQQYEYEEDFCNRRKLSPKWLIFKDAEFVRLWSNAFGFVPDWVSYTLDGYGYDSIDDFTSNYANYCLMNNRDCQAYFKKIHEIIHESHKTKANRSYQLTHPKDYLVVQSTSI